MTGGNVQVLRGPGWEAASRPVPPSLRGVVRSWCGYVEDTGCVTVRDELPIPETVIIFEIDAPVRVAGTAHVGGFVGGLADVRTRCEHDGRQAGVQINLTPIGARLLLARPMTEIAGRVIPARALLAREDHTLAERLAEAPTWEARFDLVQRRLEARLDAARIDVRAIRWAVARIEESGGAAPIGALSRSMGYSHKHVITLFRDGIGMAPKAFAAVVRFDRLVRSIRAARGVSWSGLAHAHGFADQAHLAREVRRLAGVSPTMLRTQLVGATFPALAE